jgi:hypothetical protein
MRFDPRKYEGAAKKNFGGFTPYNPGSSKDGSYYRNLGFQAYQRNEALKAQKKAAEEAAKEGAKLEMYKRVYGTTEGDDYAGEEMNRVYSKKNQIKMEADRKERTIQFDSDKGKKKKKDKKKEKSLLGKAKDFGEDTLNFLGKAGEIIDRPGDAIRTGLKQKSEGKSFLKGASEGFTGKKDTSGTEFMKLLGFDPDKDKKDAVAANLLGRVGLSRVLPGGDLIAPLIPNKTKTAIGKEAVGGSLEAAIDPLNLLGIGAIGKLSNSKKVFDKGLDLLPKKGPVKEQLALPAPKQPDFVFGEGGLSRPPSTDKISEMSQPIQKLLGDFKINPKRDSVGISSSPTEGIDRLIQQVKPKATTKPVREQFENIRPQKEPELIRVQDADNPTDIDKMKFQAEDFVKGGSKEWKDKHPAKLYRETPDRIFDEVFGKDAKKMKETYIEPIKIKEAERIQYKEKIKKDVETLFKDLRIKPGSNDDKLIQKFGEGKITEQELRASTKNADNVMKAAEWYKGYYNNVLNEINDALTRNGFDSIPKRDNYFPHFNDDNSVLKDIFGIDSTKHGLPTDINGLTEDFRPQKNFFGNAMRRKGDETSFGALQGLSGYIEGASNLIFHTDNVKNIRSLENSFRENFAGTEHMKNITAWLKEYGNQLAGKKGVLDRGFEAIADRKIYNAAKTLQSNLGKAMVGFNVSSALTGAIPSLFAASQTTKKALGKALIETIQNAVQKDGFVDESAFLTRRMGSDPLYMTKYQKASDKAFWMMNIVDNFNAQVITRGKYNELVDSGVPHKEAIKQADDFAASVLADRSKGQMPLLFNQRALGPITQFQLEVNNQLSHVFKDMPKTAIKKGGNSIGKKALYIGAAFVQLAIYSHLYNNIFEKMTGRRPAMDPIDYAMTFQDAINGDEKATEVVKDIAGQLPFSSLIVEGRVPVNAGIPDVQEMIEKIERSDGSLKSVGKEALKQSVKLPYLFLPGYGQAKKSYGGIEALNEDAPGVYTDSGKMKYYVEPSIPNKLRGAIFGKGSFPETEAYYDNDGRFLSEKQTNSVVEADDQKQAYNQVLDERFERAIQDLQKSDVSEKEKSEKLEKLLKRLRNLKGE